MTRVYLSVGSNIEKEKYIRHGVQQLAMRYAPLTLSKVYESHAIGFEGDNFYNLVVALDTEDTLEHISAALAEIEQRNGRVRNGVHFGARTLDIDLLLYGDLVVNNKSHHIPRPEIDEYACILRPLAEIAPDARHPKTGITYREMWQRRAAKNDDLRVVDMHLPESGATG